MQDRIDSFLKNHSLSPIHENRRSYIFDCPACGGSSKLYIQKNDGLSVCFKQKTEKCPSAGSSPAYALSLISGLPFNDVKKELFDFIERLSDEIKVDFGDDDRMLDKVELSPANPSDIPADMSALDSEFSKEAIKYLESRGLNIDVLWKYSIMFSPSLRRVIFPVIMNYKFYGWQGRAIDKVDKAYRMLNMPGDWKAKTLMFYDNIKNKDFAIVAEGPTSALKFEKVGNFVASLGKNISFDQMDLLIDAGIKKLFIAIDRDAFDKYEEIRQYMNNPLNKSKIECYIVNIPDHRDDFGDCTYEECEQAFNSAERLDGDDIFAYIEVK